jgi:L-ascorbate metabolism protein UlaG (beta-lactamase superfamily)
MAEFKWFGHNCFRIRAKEATIITDPVSRATGYQMPKQTADIVTISHDHSGHTHLSAVKSGYQTVSGPGEYEMHDVFITGIRTYHDDKRGEERGYNTVYLIEVEGIVICHLGDLGHPLSEAQAEAMSRVDVLLVPAGGGDVIDAAQAAEVITQLEPKLVIPMQFATEAGDKKLGGLEPLCKALAIPVPEPVEKHVVKPSDLVDTMQFVVLSPEGDGAKR